VLLSGDAGAGRVGWDAAYDRLLATCAFAAVPSRWLPATVPGGVIVMP
jgi:protein-L-isoaspartate O-methyltransferase